MTVINFFEAKERLDQKKARQLASLEETTEKIYAKSSLSLVRAGYAWNGYEYVESQLTPCEVENYKAEKMPWINAPTPQDMSLLGKILRYFR